MDTQQDIELRAIHAASSLRWDEAISLNKQILHKTPENTSALNRMARAYTQLGDLETAKKTYQKVLKLDQYNAIAKKNMQTLQHATPACVGIVQQRNSYIEEPGKTKIIQLCRVVEPSVLSSVTVGTPCTLKQKTHRISIETEKQGYIGSFPDDLSHHLMELLKGGATYQITVQSVSKTECKVFIREISKPSALAHTISFPALNQTKDTHVDAEEELLVDQNFAFDMPETDEEPDQRSHREYDDSDISEDQD